MTTELWAAQDAPAEVDEFHVRCPQTANWVIRKILEARGYRQRVREWADQETRRAERREQFLMHRFGGELEAWARREIAASGDRRRSINLPAGIVGLRVERPRLLIEDEARLLHWCRQNLPEAVQVVERVLKTPLNEHMQGTGELPEGTGMSRGGEKMYVR